MQAIASSDRSHKKAINPENRTPCYPLNYRNYARITELFLPIRDTLCYILAVTEMARLHAISARKKARESSP